MSKRLAGFYGQKCISNKHLTRPKPQEYIVLGVNQPLVAPEIEQAVWPETQPLSTSKTGIAPRKFWFFLLLNKLL